MRRTKIAVLGMMMVLSMTACAGKAETKFIGAVTTAEETTTKSMEMESGESEEKRFGSSCKNLREITAPRCNFQA